MLSLSNCNGIITIRDDDKFYTFYRNDNSFILLSNKIEFKEVFNKIMVVFKLDNLSNPVFKTYFNEFSNENFKLKSNDKHLVIYGIFGNKILINYDRDDEISIEFLRKNDIHIDSFKLMNNVLIRTLHRKQEINNNFNIYFHLKRFKKCKLQKLIDFSLDIGCDKSKLSYSVLKALGKCFNSNNHSVYNICSILRMEYINYRLVEKEILKYVNPSFQNYIELMYEV